MTELDSQLGNGASSGFTSLEPEPRAEFIAPPFTLPPYPYDRLKPVLQAADMHPGGAIDLSIGTPCDQPPENVCEALRDTSSVAGYPTSVGSAALLEAAHGWLERRIGVRLGSGSLANCIGTKELVAGLPLILKLRSPRRDTVLYPAVAYPTYEMGAILAGCRAVAVPVDDQWRIDLSSISSADAERALCLWVNTPGNPAGALDDLDAAAEWGRTHGIPVLSDECYIEFTWQGPPRTILRSGPEGVLAVHSLSKRSNFAGGRAGFYAGDADLVRFVSEVRKHQGLMIPAPVQRGAAVAWSEDSHVDVQRDRYHRRLVRLAAQFTRLGLAPTLPEGAFYLWVHAPDGAWETASRLADSLGVVVSPGEFYGAAGAAYLRIAAVQPDERLDLLDQRIQAWEAQQ